MFEHITLHHASGKAVLAGTLAFAIIAAPAAQSAVTLEGAVVDTAVSGYRGTPYTVGNSESSTYALYGITSRERSDNPCLITVESEDINAADRDSTSKKDLCGSNGATSSEIVAHFSDSGSNGEHAFITGVQVCMNNDKTRVKGLRIRGNAITPAGSPASLESSDCSTVFDPKKVGVQDGPMEYRLCGGKITQPTASRTNCDDKDGWMNWAACPAGTLATAATLHFEAGNEPRSLVGIALKCRPVAVGTTAAQSR